MKNQLLVICFLLLNIFSFSQAREGDGDGYNQYYVIVITKEGEVKNVFKEGKGITVKIEGKTVSGTWYFNAEPDVVTVVGEKGEVLGTAKLNEQKYIKLETDEPKQAGGFSFGVGIGPVGVSTGAGGGGPRYLSYNMEKNQASFDIQKETREEKIKREYNEKKALEKQQKEAERQARKEKRKKK